MLFRSLCGFFDVGGAEGLVKGLDAGEVVVHLEFFVFRDVEGGAELDVFLGNQDSRCQFAITLLLAG